MFINSILISLCVLDGIFLIFCASTARFGRGFFGMLGFVFLAWLAGYPVFSFTMEHWRDVLLGFGVYLLAGIPWAVFKWWRYAVEARNRLVEWLPSHPIPVRGKPASPLTDPERPVDEQETEYAYGERLRRYGQHVPHPTQFRMVDQKFYLTTDKSRITTWLALWPFSMLGSFLNDFLLSLWENIYEMFSGVFRRISDAVFSDINKGASQV